MSSSGENNKVEELKLAMEARKLELATELIDDMTKEELTSLTSSGETLAGVAMRQDMADLVTNIVNKSPEALQKSDSHGGVALHEAVNERTARVGLIHGAATEKVDNSGKRPHEDFKSGAVGSMIASKTASGSKSAIDPRDLLDKKESELDQSR